jgi:hypothetical protein
MIGALLNHRYRINAGSGVIYRAHDLFEQCGASRDAHRVFEELDTPA